MEVIILAGGLGTRLKSAIGDEIPKCMAPIAGKPFLWFLLNYLNRFNVSRVILSVGFLRNVIMEWVESIKKDFQFEICYSIETNPLGTGGGIKIALSKCLSDDVIVMNGDTIFKIDLHDFLEKHKRSEESITISLKPMKDTDRYGSVILNDKTHLVEGFKEKIAGRSGLINGGIYVLNKNKIKWPEEERFSFEKDILESETMVGKIYGYAYNGYFIDIGIPTDYEKAQSDFKEIFKNEIERYRIR